MQKTLKSAENARLVRLLIAVRKAAGLRQEEVAKKLGKPQSFIAKYEGGERRLDLIEFIAISRALGSDPIKLLRDFLKERSSPPAKVRK